MKINDNLGLVKNPFSKKSSEQELDFLNEIFFEPNYYETLKCDLSSGDSRFIMGHRGHGKSSIINKLVDDLQGEEHLFVILIDRFESIPVKKNEVAFLILILKTLVTKLGVFLDKNKKKINSLNQHEKEKLAFFLQLFFQTLSKQEYETIYNNIKQFKRKNYFIKFFNRFGFFPINTVASAAISITGQVVRQALNLEIPDSTNVYKEYFGKLEEFEIEKNSYEKLNPSKDWLKDRIDDLLLILEKIGFYKTIILFDKIDEYQELADDVAKIGIFTSEILGDTQLLLNDRLAIGFSLWSELKNELSGSVRFDKFDSIDVRWKINDLEPLINRRIKYFSINGQKELSDLVPNQLDRSEIIKLANKSPRDLISLLSAIYKEQSNSNQNVTHFDDRSISRGMVTFCENYDYDSNMPSRQGRNLEIKAMINRLLTVKRLIFTSRTLNEVFNQKNPASEGQIKIMQQYKLIREDEILDLSGLKSYEVIDPKVAYLIKRNILKIE